MGVSPMLLSYVHDGELRAVAYAAMDEGLKNRGYGEDDPVRACDLPFVFAEAITSVLEDYVDLSR